MTKLEIGSLSWIPHGPRVIIRILKKGRQEIAETEDVKQEVGVIKVRSHQQRMRRDKEQILPPETQRKKQFYQTS